MLHPQPLGQVAPAGGRNSAGNNNYKKAPLALTPGGNSARYFGHIAGEPEEGHGGGKSCGGGRGGHWDQTKTFPPGHQVCPHLELPQEAAASSHRPPGPKPTPRRPARARTTLLPSAPATRLHLALALFSLRDSETRRVCCHPDELCNQGHRSRAKQTPLCVCVRACGAPPRPRGSAPGREGRRPGLRPGLFAQRNRREAARPRPAPRTPRPGPGPVRPGRPAPPPRGAPAPRR